MVHLSGKLEFLTKKFVCVLSTGSFPQSPIYVYFHRVSSQVVLQTCLFWNFEGEDRILKAISDGFYFISATFSIVYRQQKSIQFWKQNVGLNCLLIRRTFCFCGVKRDPYLFFLQPNWSSEIQWFYFMKTLKWESENIYCISNLIYGGNVDPIVTFDYSNAFVTLFVRDTGLLKTCLTVRDDKFHC